MRAEQVKLLSATFVGFSNVSGLRFSMDLAACRTDTNGLAIYLEAELVYRKILYKMKSPNMPATMYSVVRCCLAPCRIVRVRCCELLFNRVPKLSKASDVFESKPARWSSVSL